MLGNGNQQQKQTINQKSIAVTKYKPSTVFPMINVV